MLPHSLISLRPLFCPEFRRLLPRKQLAFTLTELLVTLAVIIILLTLLITSSRSAMQSANAAKCVANLRQIGIAALAWSSENDGKIVSAYEDFENQRTWGYKLGPYLDSKLPSTYNADKYDATSAAVILKLPIFRCPNQDKAFDWPGYGYNSDYLSLYRTAGNPKRWVRYNQVEQLSKTVLITDQRQTTKTRWKPYVRPPSGLSDATVDFRHPSKTANVLWVDGHVSVEKTGGDLMNKDDRSWKVAKAE